MDKTNPTLAPFRIFIASSFNEEFLELRKHFAKAIDRLNDEKSGIPFKLELYRFEADDTNTGHDEGAQKNINDYIDKAHAFIMLCDSNVGLKTKEEFKHAMNRFLQKNLPAFIAVYRLNSNPPIRDNQCSYADFNAECLTKLREDEDGKTISDKYLYEYTSKNDGTDGRDEILEKFEKDLKRWILDSERRPFYDAILGMDVTPTYLYSDPSRRENCKDEIYFHRNIDDVLYSTMSDNSANSILIQGDSLSGKTRALYQAIKKFPDAWFFKFSSDSDKIVNEINLVATYLENTKQYAQTFLLIDDIHLLDDSMAEGLNTAIRRLSNRFNDKVKLIATTVDDTDLISFDKTIKIKPMSDEEYAEAWLFCRRNAIKMQTGYRNIGAMMIDLEHLKNEYRVFVEDKRIQERESIIRQAIMISIKAASIWHKSSIGDAELLCDFARYICSKMLDCNECEIRLEEIYEAIFAMSDSTAVHGIVCREVSMEKRGSILRNARARKVPKKLQIEEYIYQYILDYNGCVQEAEPQFEHELEAIFYILSYTAERLKTNSRGSESIIITLSKIARRAAFIGDVAGLIYNIITYYLDNKNLKECCSQKELELLELTGPQSPEWYLLLCAELDAVRSEIEQNPEMKNTDASLNIEYMSKILRVKMQLSETFDEAYKIFDHAPHPLQSVAMLATLIDKCEDSDKTLEQIKSLPMYQESQKSYYIITRMLKFCNDFEEALKLVAGGDFPYVDEDDNSRVNIGYYVDSTRKLMAMDRHDAGRSELFLRDFNRKFFLRAVNGLVAKVNSLAQLNELLAMVRTYYVLFLNNMSLAERFQNNTDVYRYEDLTMIDLLAQLQMLALPKMFETIASNHIDGEIPLEIETFIRDVLYPELDKTLAKHRSILTTFGGGSLVLDDSIIYTPSYKAKSVASVVLNSIIKSCSHLPYRVVLEKLFIPMQHITDDGKNILLRDSFTYGAMLENKSCKYIDAIELYHVYIKPHDLDRSEHFRISHLVLNRIMKKVSTISEYQYVDRLFDDAGVDPDRYTYNNALSILPYDICVKKIIPAMFQRGVEFDMYTLGHLICKAPTIKVAAGYFAISNSLQIPCESNGIPTNTLLASRQQGVANAEEVKLEDKVSEMVQQYTNVKNTALPLQHYFWAVLFLKECYSDEDREILWKFLNYLKTAHDGERLLSDGVIYNNCVKNGSFIRGYESAQEFIKKHKVEVDVFTFMHLQNIIINEYGDSGCEELNHLYKRYKEVVVSHLRSGRSDLYKNRLSIFQSHNSVLKLLFIDKDGHESKCECTPLQSIQHMLKNHILVDKYIIGALFKIRGGDSATFIENLVQCIIDNNIRVDNLNIKALIEKYKSLEGVVGFDAKKLYDLPTSNDNYSKGYTIIAAYQNGLFDLSEAFAELENNVENSVERVYAYTNLLSQYRRVHDKQLTDKVFDDAWELYENHVKGKIAPNADIISVLANLTYNVENIEKLLAESRRADVKPNEYMMTSMMRVSENFAQAKTMYETYKRMGGRLSQGAVDAILFGLSAIAVKKEDKEVRSFIVNLTDYILGLDTACAYPAGLSAFPCFEAYSKTDITISCHTLRSLIMALPVCTKDYVDKISELLKRYYKDADNTTSNELLAEEFYNISFDRKRNPKHLKVVDAINLLKPYPNLAFSYAFSLVAYGHIYGYHCMPMAEYGLLVDIWQDNFDVLPTVKIADMLSNVAKCTSQSDRATDRGSFEKVVQKLYYFWSGRVTTNAFRDPSREKYPNAKIVDGLSECVEFNKYFLKERFHSLSKQNRSQAAGENVVNTMKEAYNAKMLKREQLYGFLEINASKLDFDRFKIMLDMINVEDVELKKAILDVMAKRFASYSELLYIINYICNYRILFRGEFFASVIDRLLQIRHDRAELYHISNQVLDAIQQGGLTIRDFIRGRLSYYADASNYVELKRTKENLYKLINTLYDNYSTKSSEGLLTDAMDAVACYYTLNNPKQETIDAIIVQELLNVYVLCHNKHDVNDRDAKYFDVVESILSNPIIEEEGDPCVIDVSTLFPDDVRKRLGKPERWYQIKSNGVSRMILGHLSASIDKGKDEIIYKSHSSVTQWLSHIGGEDYNTLLVRTIAFINRNAKDVGEGYYNTKECRDLISLMLQSVHDVENLKRIITYILSHVPQFRVDSKVLIDTIFRVVGSSRALCQKFQNYNRDKGLSPMDERPRNTLVGLVEKSITEGECSAELIKALKSWQRVKDNKIQSAGHVDSIVKLCEECGCKLCKKILSNKHFLVCRYWRPDVGFFKTVLGIDVAGIEDIDSRLARLFDNYNGLGDIIKYHVNDIYLHSRLLKGGIDAKTELGTYAKYNASRFANSLPINNPYLIVTYIRKSRCHVEVLRRIWSEYAYKSSYITFDVDAGGKIFTDVMSAPIFRELSQYIEFKKQEWTTKKTRVSYSTTLLMHKLLVCCGIDFILEDDKLLGDVAKTITTVQEYVGFVNDLKTFHLPVSPITIEAILDAAMRLAEADNGMKWFVARLRALAEFDSYHQGTDCHDFKAGYIDLVNEKDDSYKRWKNRDLHMSKDSKVLESIKSRPVKDRVNDIKRLDSVSLRHLALLKLIDSSSQKERYSITKYVMESLYNLLRELSSPSCLDIPYAHMRRIVSLWANGWFKVPSYVDNEWRGSHKDDGDSNRINTLCALISYFKAVRDSGGGYAISSAHILSIVEQKYRGAIEKNFNEVRVQCSVFTGRKNKSNDTPPMYLSCSIDEMAGILTDTPSE